MGETALVRADDEHELGAGLAVRVGGQGNRDAPGVLRRVAVQVEHHLEGGVGGKIALDGLAHALIGAVVVRVVVRLGVVQDFNARILQDLRDLVSDADDGVAAVLRAQLVRLRVFKSGLHGIGLARMRMDDQDGRPVLLKIEAARLQEQRLLVRRVAAGSGDPDPVRLLGGEDRRGVSGFWFRFRRRFRLCFRLRLRRDDRVRRGEDLERQDVRLGCLRLRRAAEGLVDGGRRACRQ